MQCFGDFVVNNAKGGLGEKRVDYQRFSVYPSFIVRLSFVIGSFNLRDSYKLAGVMMKEERVDYQEIGVRRRR